MNPNNIEANLLETIEILDQSLSKRFIELDSEGYFIIKIDSLSNQILVEHYDNNIDHLGRSVHPETGEPLPCKGSERRIPSRVFKGKSAKEIGIQITEGDAPYPLSKLDHALYLGRELQKAEECLKNKTTYIQD